MASPNFKNRTFYHCDNLPVLRGMNSKSVHLIATDPPFNKSKDFHATPDSLARGAKFQDRWSWRRDIHDEWLIEIQRDYPEVWSVITTAKQVWGDGMGAFLCWLGVRLLEMHRVLRDDGSIYLHIDHTAHAYVKTLMDAIFGKDNFRNEIVWAYTGPGSPRMKQFSRKHDTLLFYSNGQKWTFNADAVRIPHKQLNTNRKGRVIADAMTPEVRDAYLKRGKVPETWWTGFTPVGRLVRERTGYPTQKPLALYERIIKASSDEGDIVLDPFAGCATTPVAAERLGRQWVGIDIWEGAYDLVLERLQDEWLDIVQNGGGTGVLANSLALSHSARWSIPLNRLFAQITPKPLSWSYRHRRDAPDATRRRVNSVTGCYWTWVRIVRDADAITALTRECWKLTMLCQSQTAARTHTTT